MTQGNWQASSTKDSGNTSPSQPSDPALETLREILFSQYRRRIAELEAELDSLEQRIENKDAFVAVVTPILGDAIRRKIRDARDEMVEALYPIIGQTVVRAVSEAIRDLSRAVDAQMRSAINLQMMGRRVQAQIRGISSAEMVLRESLPFDVAEVFLVHHETGLLLWHISRDPVTASDSDLVSGMLTAIRDFAEEAFGRGKEGELEEIQYGEWRILIEVAQYAYLAVVIDGIEPSGFRSEMRERVIEVDLAHESVLRSYQGDPTPLAPVEEPLRSLMAANKPHKLSPTQKRLLGISVGMLTLCLAATCFAGAWAWQMMRSTPTPVPVVVEPTATPTFTITPSPTSTATPTPTFTPTSTPTFTPTPTSTFTSTPTPTPITGLMTGNVWLRQEPFSDASRLGLILERGQPVEILAAYGDWYQVRWSPQAQTEVIGWIPIEWVGTLAPIPDRMITPTGP